MEKESLLKIIYLKKTASTQLYLKELIQKKEQKAPVAVVADEQTQGLGSRGNSWVSQKGNLFLSFALPLKDLPQDLKLESASIYFAYILKETLSGFGSSVFLKWPNDFYLAENKVGGMITTVVNDSIVCGVGINTASEVSNFARLDIDIERGQLLASYFNNLGKNILWKQVFSNYRLEFDKNKKLFTHKNKLEIPLASAKLEDDGSLSIDGERIYSRR